MLLLDQITLWIHPDGSAEQETHQLHRLQDPRGKDDLGTVHADGDVKIVQTILPDGRTLVPNQIGRGAFEMAGLAPGVVVERRYRRCDRPLRRPSRGLRRLLLPGHAAHASRSTTRATS